MHRALTICVIAAAAHIAPAAPPAWAGPVTQTYFFGDSLSDTGNRISRDPAAGADPIDPTRPSPYFNGRFSNGPVWADGFAAGLGTSSTASDFGGPNYAVGGAVAADLAGQIAAFQASGTPINPDDLFTIWIGGNDARVAGDPIAAVGDVIAGVNMLIGLGAQRIMVSNLPIFEPVFSPVFNAALAPQLSAIMGVDLVQFDAQSLFLAVLNDPAAFGFDPNVVNNPTPIPCLLVAACVAAPLGPFDPTNPRVSDAFVFHDPVPHPTASAHALVAQGALNALPAAFTTPMAAASEPGALGLIVIGLAVGGLARRRRGA